MSHQETSAGLPNERVPLTNLETYRLLFQIEVALREMAIELLDGLDGPGWWRHRLPPDVLESCKRGLQYERKTKWSQLVIHHPLYYTEFPDLKKVITLEKNWNDAFKAEFGRKDVIEASLSELEPIRNKIAHNRLAPPGDLEIVRSAYAKLSAWITPQRLERLAARCSQAEQPLQSILALRAEAEAGYSRVKGLTRPYELFAWSAVSTAWWFDDECLGSPTVGIREYFRLLGEYNSLPRTRGQGYQIERWVQQAPLDRLYNAAMITFDALGLDIS